MTRYFTIEVYNRRKWSDRYSCQYLTKQEAEDRARELYKQDEFHLNYKNVPHISEYYRIKETIEETTTHELQ